MARVSRAPFLSLVAALVLGCGSSAPATPRIATAGENPGPTATPGDGLTTSLPPVDIGTAGAAAIDATFAVASLVLAGGKAMGRRHRRRDRSPGRDGTADAVGRRRGSVRGDGPGLRRRLDGDVRARGDRPDRRPVGCRRERHARRPDHRCRRVHRRERGGHVAGRAGRHRTSWSGIDPRTLEVVNRKQIAPAAHGVRAGFGDMWGDPPAVADEVLQVDAGLGAGGRPIHVGGGPRYLADQRQRHIGPGGTRDGDRLEPRRRGVKATIRLGRRSTTATSRSAAAGCGSRRLRAAQRASTRRTDRVTQRYGPPSSGGSVAAGDDAVLGHGA